MLMSLAPRIAEITTIPSAPESITLAALLLFIPPIARIGMFTLFLMVCRPSNPRRGLRLSLDDVGKIGPTPR